MWPHSVCVCIALTIHTYTSKHMVHLDIGIYFTGQQQYLRLLESGHFQLTPCLAHDTCGSWPYWLRKRIGAHVFPGRDPHAKPQEHWTGNGPGTRTCYFLYSLLRLLQANIPFNPATACAPVCLFCFFFSFPCWLPALAICFSPSQ